jgi:nucleotide-binding universal stress UspA family protein
LPIFRCFFVISISNNNKNISKMDKILVPVDFSASSDWGFYYAYEMARQFGATLVAVHLYRPPYIETTMPANMISAIIAEKEQAMLAHLRANTHPSLASQEAGESVKIEHILESWAASNITDVAKRINADLIVMGTHGADGAWNRVWGSNTSKVIAEAHCPVLAIPARTEYKKIENLAYATDYDVTDLDNISQLAAFASVIKANLHCIHINLVTGEDTTARGQIFEEQFNARFAAQKKGLVNFSIRSSISVEDGLETFLRINNINILSMLTHKRGFWEKMFSNKSVTESMAMRARTPLLAFHK